MHFSDFGRKFCAKNVQLEVVQVDSSKIQKALRIHLSAHI